MKYWRGYLTAAILVAFTWGLQEFAKGHSALVDMIYPYVTRMVQNFLVGWNGTVEYCLWQVLLLVILALIIASVVLMIVFKWNIIQWFGWVCAVGAAVVFLNTTIYGLNEFAGPLSDDIRLEETDYTVTELENAAAYFRDQANELAEQVERDLNGNVIFADLDTLKVQAADGFNVLVYEKSEPVFAGSLVPVKTLRWPEQFTARGITGLTVGLTGEAAINPQTPAVMMPFAICREMAHRMCIAVERDASFGAYLACMENSSVQFQYSGAMMGYRYCLKALESLESTSGESRTARVVAYESPKLQHDLQVCDDFFGDAQLRDADACDLLTSWHIQEVVLPSLVVEEEVFDPMDKTQVDLSGLPNVKQEDSNEKDTQ